MLDFCSDRGFFSLTALDLSPGTGGRLFRLRRAAIDFIADLLAALIPQYSIFPFLSSKIAAVAMNRFFLPGKQLRCHGHIVDIGSSDPLQTTLTRWEQFCFAMSDLAKRNGRK